MEVAIITKANDREFEDKLKQLADSDHENYTQKTINRTLEKTNKSLKEELETLKKENNDLKYSKNDWENKYKDLHQKYNDLNSNFKRQQKELNQNYDNLFKQFSTGKGTYMPQQSIQQSVRASENLTPDRNSEFLNVDSYNPKDTMPFHSQTSMYSTLDSVNVVVGQ